MNANALFDERRRVPKRRDTRSARTLPTLSEDELAARIRTAPGGDRPHRGGARRQESEPFHAASFFKS